MRLRLIIATLVCLSLPGRLMADDWPVERGGASREPSPYRYDAKKPIPRAFLDDAPACILYSGSTYLVEDDGMVETIFHEVVRLNSRKAIERLGEFHDIGWNPVWQKLLLHEARVIKADGSVVQIEPRHVHFRDTSTDFQVYDRDKQLAISFPNLEVGDTIEVKWSTRGKNPEYFGQFFARNTFGDDRFPTVVDELRVRLPKTKDFTYATVNGQLKPVVQGEGETVLYQWKVENLPALPRDENLPTKENLRPQVACTTFKSWDAVAEWKHKIRDKCWECTPDMRAVVNQVAGPLNDPLAKAQALSQWVRKRVRYVSVSATGAGYTPQLPARVLANRFGDCKDQSQLLAVMMKEAGLDVELVTLGVLDDGQVIPEVPMPWGTHAILLVTIDGQQHWIDTTVSGGPWDFLPRDDRDRVAYVVGDHGIRLLRTPSFVAADSRTVLTTHIDVRADGTSDCKRSLQFFGMAAMQQRDAWFETAASDRRRLAAAELQEANNRVKLHGLSVDDAALLDWEGPVLGHMNYEIVGHFGTGADREASLGDSKMWNRLLGVTIDHERMTPVDLGMPFESTHRYIVQLPAAYCLDGLPRERNVRSKWGLFEVKVESDPAKPRWLEIQFFTRLDKTVVEPADFADFHEFQDELHTAWRTWVALTPTKDAKDIPLLLCHLWTHPADSGSAAVLTQLLANNAQADVAHRVLRLAQVFRPDDEPLWELAVKLAATTKDQEKVCRQMVERFPDRPQYGVQLGAMRVKLGDHAGAAKILEPLTKTAPDGLQAKAHLQLARSLLAQDKPADALHHVFQTRLIDPDSNHGVQIALLEGEALEQLHSPDKAAEAYRNVLELEPDHPSALAALIRLELAAGMRAQAVGYLRRYTLAAMDDREGLEKAAGWYLQLGRLEEAKDLALRAFQMKAGPATHRVLGLVLSAQGDHAKAVFQLSRAEPEAEALLALLRGYLALGQLREALDVLDKCQPFCAKNQELAGAVASVRLLEERRQSYIKDARVARSRRTAYREAIDAFLCASLAHSGGQPAHQVEVLLAKALAKNADCAPALALRGLTLLEHGQLTKALADAERALVLDPREPLGYLVRGRVRLERDQKDALADLARAALLTKRLDGLVLHWLASAQYQAGQREEALATQAEAAVLLPGVSEVREQLQEFKRSFAVKAGG